MQVKSFMSTDLILLSPDDTLGEAATLFLDKKIDGAPVVEDGQLVGLLTKTHLIRAMSQGAPLHRTAGEFMSRLMKILSLEQPIDQVDIIDSDCYLVVEKEELVGIVSKSDIIAALNEIIAELDGIIDSSSDGLCVTDGSGMTLRINPALKRMTGLEEEDLVNRKVNKLVENGVLSRSASLLALERKEPVTTTVVTAAGTTLLVSATPVWDEKGDIFRVVANVRDISELNMLKQKVEKMEGLKKHFEFQMNAMKSRLAEQLIFKNQEMEKVVYQAMKIAEVDSTVLISGESGVGKEVIGEIIQCNSIRNKDPFVKLNCAAIPENLLESELFGYEPGAFTGARREGKPGLFEVATEGTMLLDEIGDVPLHLQVKLLRALQQQEIFRVGGTKPINIDVRIIAITNRDLEAMVRKGEFREDLYYRLNVVPIHVPALRERREDIPLLVRHFLAKFNKRYSLKKSISPEAIELMTFYPWPGNIRQLENLIERLVVIASTEEIDIQHLPVYFIQSDGGGTGSHHQPISVNSIIPLKKAVESLERQLLEKTFSVTSSCYKAARLLEVDASTVSRKATRYNIKYKGN